MAVTRGILQPPFEEFLFSKNFADAGKICSNRHDKVEIEKIHIRK